MNILIITHAKFERPGIIHAWADSNQHSVQILAPYRDETLPAINDIDLLIIMGGPQSPSQLDAYPYLALEIDYIKECLIANKPMLGICLGAQLIAEALGAKTERSPHKEVGAFPIQLTTAAKQDVVFKRFQEEFTVMHWHYDMPGLPDGAQILATSHGCPRQVIRFKMNAYGLQCHFEMTAELIAGMIKHCKQDLAPSTYTQQPEAMLATNFSTMHQYLTQLLTHLSTPAA